MVNKLKQVEDTLKKISGEMEVEKRVHKGWTEWDNSKEYKKFRPIPLFGKWQYIYKSKKGRISLVKLNEKSYFTSIDGLKDIKEKDYWEIYSNGDLFDDVERFETKKLAEVKIKEYLNGS